MTSSRVAVVTTFSRAGWDSYARAMVMSWLKFWPSNVDLFLYPDTPIAFPERSNLHVIIDPLPEKEQFIRRWSAFPIYRGGDPYNYRFDAVKFCHKPYALHHFATRLAKLGNYGRLVWLDADTITHAAVNSSALERIAPPEFDLQFLGRPDKYTECGYLYFNLQSVDACDLLERWVGYYQDDSFRNEAEWHDSWLFDQARARTPGLNANDLSGHMAHHQGGSHPLINSFLGLYLDHFKGNARKAARAPRKNDLFTDHDTPYWKAHAHAKDKRRRTPK